ncbi:MAG: ATP-grasp fold amidoligase family protein [Prevotellaceae bacterium]|nr:ATP-grasp fold amidoligase family protein [Prevotellaceae bacterium]
MQKIKKIISTILLRFGGFIPDKLYLTWLFYLKTGTKMNWDSPKTYTEKLNWLKVYDRSPSYTLLVDKVKVKDYVKKLIGEEYIIPILGVWDKVDDIDFDKLPNQFVLKCNHNSSTGICICKDKSLIKVANVKRDLKKGLNQNYYNLFREWPYKNVKRKIFAEKLLVDKESEILTDYKFFCFNGKPHFMYISKDIAKNATTDFFDMEYNKLPFRMRDPNSQEIPKKPKEFDKMKELAEKLSKGFPHIRVDFYVVNHCIYFGELTFYHNAGCSPVYPNEWDIKLGSLINIEEIKKPETNTL